MIPAETIVEVRSRHDLVAFIEGCGVKLRRRGSEYFGLCPFHRDREPSLAVSAAKQYWCCHGACSSNGRRIGGDVIEFARRIWGVSFPEALRRLDLTVASALAPAAAPAWSPLRLASLCPSQYLKAESIFQEHALSMGHPTGVVDLAVWIVMRVARREGLI